MPILATERVARTSARRVTIVATLLTVALLGAACGASSGSGSGVAQLPSRSSTTSTISTSTGSSPSTTESAQEQLLRFTQCVRLHGVPKFPDPNSNGGLSESQLNALKSTPSLKPALVACESDLPQTRHGVPTNPSDQTTLLKFAECMHAHGVANFPEPSSTTKPAPGSIDTSSPQFQRAIQACQSLLGPLTSSGAAG